MNWDDLRLFLAIAREGSVSGAGKQLGMHHTNVARRMSRFEQVLGTCLFVRSKTGYAMTVAGEQLYREALSMEEQAQAIERSMMSLDSALRGTVKFTANQDVVDVLIAPRLRSFYTRYPHICLEILTAPRVLNLDAREADIALRLTSRPDEHLIGRRISTMAMGIYGSPAYHPQPGEPVRVILFHRQTSMPSWVVKHFPDAVVAMRADNLRTARAGLRAGIGIANMPCFYADADPGLRRLAAPFEGLEYGVWLLSHADLRTTARIRACREWLTQILNEQRDLLIGKKSQWLADDFTEERRPPPAEGSSR